MFKLYGLFSLMLIGAISLLAIPFIKNRQKNSFSYFFIISLLMIVLSSLFYKNSGDQTALNQWLTQDKQHYELLVKFNELGGIDGIIARIQKKLAINPEDAQGWFILGKLYLAKKNNTAAAAAFKKAHALSPQHAEILHYYQITAQ